MNNLKDKLCEQVRWSVDRQVRGQDDEQVSEQIWHQVWRQVDRQVNRQINPLKDRMNRSSMRGTLIE